MASPRQAVTTPVYIENVRPINKSLFIHNISECVYTVPFVLHFSVLHFHVLQIRALHFQRTRKTSELSAGWVNGHMNAAIMHCTDDSLAHVILDLHAIATTQLSTNCVFRAGWFASSQCLNRKFLVWINFNYSFFTISLILDRTSFTIGIHENSSLWMYFRITIRRVLTLVSHNTQLNSIYWCMAAVKLD